MIPRWCRVWTNFSIDFRISGWTSRRLDGRVSTDEFMARYDSLLRIYVDRNSTTAVEFNLIRGREGCLYYLEFPSEKNLHHYATVPPLPKCQRVFFSSAAIRCGVGAPFSPSVEPEATLGAGSSPADDDTGTIGGVDAVAGCETTRKILGQAPIRVRPASNSRRQSNRLSLRDVLGKAFHFASKCSLRHPQRDPVTTDGEVAANADNDSA